MRQRMWPGIGQSISRVRGCFWWREAQRRSGSLGLSGMTVLWEPWGSCRLHKRPTLTFTRGNQEEEKEEGWCTWVKVLHWCSVVFRHRAAWLHCYAITMSVITEGVFFLNPSYILSSPSFSAHCSLGFLFLADEWNSTWYLLAETPLSRVCTKMLFCSLRLYTMITWVIRTFLPTRTSLAV